MISEVRRNWEGKKCLELLSSYLDKHKDLRLEQLIYILDESKDYFYEEPEQTFKRWQNKIEELEKGNENV